MKINWQTKKLGEVCDILDNKRKPITKRNRTSGKYPYYGATGILDYVGDYIFDEKLVLIGEDGAKWKSGEYTAFIVNGKYWVNNHAHVIRPYKDTILDKWIVFYFYLTDLTKYTTGLTVPKLNQTNLRDIEIPTPPFQEQKRIVSILDKAFSTIDKAKSNSEQNLKNAKEIFENYLQGVFENGDWGTKTVMEITKVVNGYAFSSRDFKSTNTIKSVKIANVGVQEFIEEVDNYLPEKFKLTLNDFQVNEGNIVIALTRTIISTGLKVAIIPATYDGALVNQRVAALVSNEKIINQSFLYYYLTTKSVEKYVLAHVNTLMQPNLSINDLKNLPVPFPDIKEQETVVRELGTLQTKSRKLETIYQQKLNNLEELKKSILQKAFSGEL